MTVLYHPEREEGYRRFVDAILSAADIEREGAWTLRLHQSHGLPPILQSTLFMTSAVTNSEDREDAEARFGEQSQLVAKMKEALRLGRLKLEVLMPIGILYQLTYHDLLFLQDVVLTTPGLTVRFLLEPHYPHWQAGFCIVTEPEGTFTCIDRVHPMCGTTHMELLPDWLVARYEGRWGDIQAAALSVQDSKARISEIILA